MHVCAYQHTPSCPSFTQIFKEKVEEDGERVYNLTQSAESSAYRVCGQQEGWSL